MDVRMTINPNFISVKYGLVVELRFIRILFLIGWRYWFPSLNQREVYRIKSILDYYHYITFRKTKRFIGRKRLHFYFVAMFMYPYGSIYNIEADILYQIFSKSVGPFAAMARDNDSYFCICQLILCLDKFQTV
jgi:hypothetical protein